MARHPVIPETMEVFTVRFTMCVCSYRCALGAAVRIISTLADISTPDLNPRKQECYILDRGVRSPYHL
jgi:hypothetical protein